MRPFCEEADAGRREEWSLFCPGCGQCSDLHKRRGPSKDQVATDSTPVVTFEVTLASARVFGDGKNAPCVSSADDVRFCETVSHRWKGTVTTLAALRRTRVALNGSHQHGIH